MKNSKVIIVLIGLIGASSASAGYFAAPRQSNYEQFIRGYRGDIIDTGRNIISPAFVYEAVKALRADGPVDLRDPNVATNLWRSIDNVVKYYATLPANRNNRDFTTRIWQSLVRALDEDARAQQPITRPINQQMPTSTLNGVAELRSFRQKTSQIIQTNPTYFYSAGAVQPSWLREALHYLTGRVGIVLTMQNQAVIREELANTAAELMRQILRSDFRLSSVQKENVIKMVRAQVEQFVDSQVMRSRM